MFKNTFEVIARSPVDDEAISNPLIHMKSDCFASLAMTAFYTFSAAPLALYLKVKNNFQKILKNSEGKDEN